MKLRLRELFPLEPFRFIRWQPSPYKTFVSEKWWVIFPGHDCCLVRRADVGDLICPGDELVATYRRIVHPVQTGRPIHRYVRMNPELPPFIGAVRPPG